MSLAQWDRQRREMKLNMRVTVPAEPIEFGGPAAPVVDDLWPSVCRSQANTGKFTDPLRTVAGEERASVAVDGLETLWFNTGTLCNIACENCYIESSPGNDRLVYITCDEVAVYLDEIEKAGLPTDQIGFTGGEPFMNRDMPAMLEECLSRGYRTLAEASGPVRLNHPHCARFCVLGQASCSA
jgi:sulfatase maturation enzyme AslB (radical SAM superfamily)